MQHIRKPNIISLIFVNRLIGELVTLIMNVMIFCEPYSLTINIREHELGNQFHGINNA